MLFNLLEGEAVDTATEQAAQTASSGGIDWGAVWNTIVNWVMNVGIKIVIAILLLIISFKLVNLITKKLYKRLQKKKADETIARVSTQCLRIGLKVIILACLIGYVGIETASISAVIASIGIGISLAVQGTLSNFAGGVIIIIMRPFKIGDYITSNGEEGTVEDIKLFYTHIVTNDNRAVVIPNGALANSVIVNASAKDTRRVDIVASVAYGSDIAKVREVLKNVCAENELVFQDPAPFVELNTMNESSLDFTVRAWCNRGDYWTVKFALNDAIVNKLTENGIEIPFNQLDVTLKNALPAPEESATAKKAAKEKK